jgi:hypothetical protein
MLATDLLERLDGAEERLTLLRRFL